MVVQKLSIASLQDQQSPQANAKLIMEIGLNHIALLVKNGISTQSFELYDIPNNTGNWQGIFDAIINQSKVLNKEYSNTNVYINTLDALIVPAEKFRQESMEPYLTAVYGNANDCKCEADVINIPTNPATIYRCPLLLDAELKKRLGTFTYKHTYSKILENLLGNGKMLLEMLKVQFYAKTMLVTVIYGNKLMLMQSYPYNSPEDIIYYLLNIVQEFSLNVSSTPVEISGMIDINSRHFELLENVFGRLSLETVATESIFKEHLNVANAHYYTPFINLSI
jgi:Protein of unknown function (DUF3822)